MSDFKIVKLLDPAVQLITNIKPTGVYNPSTTYGIGDSVSYQNSSYIAIQPTTGNIPTNTTYWQLLASTSTNRLGTTARNLTGSVIPAGAVVYFSGVSGNLPTLALAQANSEMSSTKTIGITATSINNNADGEVVVFGLADNLDTTAFPAGSALWLSPTVPGGLTTVKPSAPNHMVFIGFLTRSHPTQGTIEVKIQNGFELEELHNVSIVSLTDGQTLKYDASTQLWKNHTLTKSDVGLSNVDNTSDLNKPISTATQTALNGKQDLLGFTPENVINKSTNTALGTSNTLYPTQNAVKTYVDAAVSGVSVPDATTSIKGVIKLAGDLSGTADLPTVPGLATKEPLITAGTTSQYYRGDKTFQTLNKTAVGLSNVDNTSDLNKPVSTAQAAADAAVQAYSIQRANHTGTQSASTITGLATVATSGSYNDLTNQPTGLPPTGAAGGDLAGNYPNPTLSQAKESYLIGLSAGFAIALSYP